MLANRLAVPFASNLLARVGGCIAGKRRPAEQSSAAGIAWLLLTYGACWQWQNLQETVRSPLTALGYKAQQALRQGVHCTS